MVRSRRLEPATRDAPAFTLLPADMMHIPSPIRICAAISLVAQAFTALAFTSHAGYAQTPTMVPRNSISIVAGASQFDLSGTGTAPILGVRYDRVVARWLVTQGSLAMMRPKEQLGQRNQYVIPEFQVQAQLPRETVRPYLGVGTGFFLGNNGSRTRATFTTALGTRVRVPERPIDVVLELRVRGVGESFSGSAAEWTAGLAYRF